MNKTIIININGIVFHIEEDAYEVLKNYMTDVKRHFMDSADSLEITTDIENRLAEMFSEILARDNKQVIVEQDVLAVISQMGTVEDFASADEEEKRSAEPKFRYATESRRLFRDPDDHLAAGVCAGIASYFDIQPVWIRLAFAAAFCFFGSGLFLYIILWLVIPKALTRADRMAMKGEKLDLQGFKRNFEDELKGAQSHLNNLHDEVKPLIYKTRDFAGDFFEYLRVFLLGASKVFVKISGVLIMLVCLGLTIALLITVFAFFAYGKHNIDRVFPFNIVNHEYALPFITGAFFLVALPLLGLILLTTRIVFNRTAIARPTGYTLLVLWLVSLCVVVYYSVEVAAEFKSGGRFSQTISIKPVPGNVYHLQLNNVRYLSSEDSARLDIKHSFAGKIILDDDNEYDNDRDDNGSPRNVTINIEQSDVAKPVLIESFSARGRDYADALMNARNVVYQFKQTDSLLTFDRRLQHQGNGSWRGQEVRLTLKVPIGTELVIDQKLDQYLDGIDIYGCQNKTMLEHATTAPFIMAANGLQCYMPKPDSTAKVDSTENQ
jgi:phage shock protein PspC (stress-responsive transcriptional regulator)